MYQDFFGFGARPFELTPDPEFLYLSNELREVVATLEYGIIQRRGFILLVGRPGTGKTTLINSLMDKAKRNVNFAYIFNPALSFDDLLQTVLVKFGIATVDEELSKTKAMHRLNTYVDEEYKKNRNTVIIVDEAQYLDTKTLEYLRLLSNLETHKDKLIQIIISGQPELLTTLGQKSLIQLAQRIGLKCQTKPLTEKETHEYIEHRLKVAGYHGPQLFANKATHMIWAHSEGIPRTINILCDHALLSGYSSDTKRIDSSIVQEVIDGLNGVQLNNLESEDRELRDPTKDRLQKPSDKSGGIHDRPPGFSAPKKDYGTGIIDIIKMRLFSSREPVPGERKEKRFSLAWTATIAAFAIIINVVIFYIFVGNLKNFEDGLSSKLKGMKDTIQDRSEGKNIPSDMAPAEMLQRSDTNDNNENDSKVDASAAKSILQHAAGRSQTESKVDSGRTGYKDFVVVQKGETLEEIMLRVYRRKDLKILDAILKINPEIKNPNLIYENQIIQLPSKADELSNGPFKAIAK